MTKDRLNSIQNLETDELIRANELLRKEIEARHLIEKQLRANQERFQNLVESIEECIWEVDTEFIYTYISPKIKDMLGYEAYDVLSKSYFDFVNSDESEKFTETLFDISQQQKPFSNLETTFLSKNNKVIVVETSGAPFFDIDGNCMGYRGVHRNITDLKFAINMVSENEERYRLLFENANEAICIVQNDSNQFFNNKFCEITGYQFDELGKIKFSDLIFKKDVNKVTDNLLITKVDEASKVNEFRLQNKDKSLKWAIGNSVGFVWLNEPATLIFISDITEQHRSHEQVIQSEKLAAIGTLAAGVAHEINNPIGYINSNLNTMLKYLNKIKAGLRGKDNLQESVDNINGFLDDFEDAITESLEGTKRVKKIVCDLKDFSRVDKEKYDLANINQGIETTLSIVWNELKYHCEVIKELGDLPDIYCNLNQLNQVFMNLLVNAGHAIDKDKKGLIKIKTWSEENTIFISFNDNGNGIPEENMNKLFEPFFTTKEVGKGTGLGLSLTYDIIKKHRGLIIVESEVEVGTTFTISLPIVKTEDELTHLDDSRIQETSTVAKY